MSGFRIQVNLVTVLFVTEVATLSYLNTWDTKVRIMYVLIVVCDSCMSKKLGSSDIYSVSCKQYYFKSTS